MIHNTFPLIFFFSGGSSQEPLFKPFVSSKPFKNRNHFVYKIFIKICMREREREKSQKAFLFCFVGRAECQVSSSSSSSTSFVLPAGTDWAKGGKTSWGYKGAGFNQFPCPASLHSRPFVVFSVSLSPTGQDLWPAVPPLYMCRRDVLVLRTGQCYIAPLYIYMSSLERVLGAFFFN